MKTLQEMILGQNPPSDWEMQKLKHVFRTRKENKNAGLKEKNLLSLSYGRIVRKDIKNFEGLVPESYEGYQIVEPGDIVLRLTDLQNDKKSLRQGLVTERGIITSAYDAIFLSKNDNPDFWFYTLYALDICKYYYSLGGGVRQSISFSDFPNDWIAAPEPEKQEEIVGRIRRALNACDAIIKLIGGNRSAQVAEEGTLLSRILERKSSVIVSFVVGDFGSDVSSDLDSLTSKIVLASSENDLADALEDIRQVKQ